MRMLKQMYHHSGDLSHGFSGHDCDCDMCSSVILNTLLNHPLSQCPHLYDGMINYIYFIKCLSL